MSQEPVPSDITSDDKLWAMLGYIIPIIALVVLFIEDKKNRPYIKFNAVQSLVAVVILSIISTVTLLALVTVICPYHALLGLSGISRSGCENPTDQRFHSQSGLGVSFPAFQK